MTSYADPKLRSWRRLVGETGDLADIVVATLSLASMHYGVAKVSLSDFYEEFGKLQQEYPNLIPDLQTGREAGVIYSKVLGDAVESALRLGVDIANPRFQYLVVSPDKGERALQRLRKRTGDEFIDKLEPVAASLAAALRSTEPVGLPAG